MNKFNTDVECHLVLAKIALPIKLFKSLIKIFLKWYLFFSDCKRVIHDLRGAIGNALID